MKINLLFSLDDKILIYAHITYKRVTVFLALNNEYISVKCALRIVMKLERMRA